jgi:hypothetical protein
MDDYKVIISEHGNLAWFRHMGPKDDTMERNAKKIARFTEVVLKMPTQWIILRRINEKHGTIVTVKSIMQSGSKNSEREQEKK